MKESINWSDPNAKREYFRNYQKQYKKEHPRVYLTFTPEEYASIAESFEQYGNLKMAAHVKALVMEALKNDLGEQAEYKPMIPKEILDKMLSLLHNQSNNLNQISYRLNADSKLLHTRVVANKEQSVNILDECYRILRDLEQGLTEFLNTQ